MGYVQISLVTQYLLYLSVILKLSGGVEDSIFMFTSRMSLPNVIVAVFPQSFPSPTLLYSNNAR